MVLENFKLELHIIPRYIDLYNNLKYIMSVLISLKTFLRHTIGFDSSKRDDNKHNIINK